MKRTVSLILLVTILAICVYATVTTIKYTLNQQETCTLASLAATSGGSARSCAMLNNSSNTDIEDQVWVVFKTGASPNASGTVTVYAYGCYNASTANCTDAGEVLGTDVGITIPTTGTNLPLLVGPVNCWGNVGATTYKCGPFSMAQTFGGSIPSGYGTVIVNNTGAAFDATCTGCGVFFDRIQLQNAWVYWWHRWKQWNPPDVGRYLLFGLWIVALIACGALLGKRWRQSGVAPSLPEGGL